MREGTIVRSSTLWPPNHLRSQICTTMFVSLPHYEFPFPPELTQPDAQHWRMVELMLHAPWFLVSVEVPDVEDPDLSMTRTLCIAWDTDLADILRSLEADRVKGIVCMMPAWQSQHGQWTSRIVREVWMCQSDAGQSISVCDSAGKPFDCGLVLRHMEPVERELLFRLPLPAPTRRAHPRPRFRRHSSRRRVTKA